MWRYSWAALVFAVAVFAASPQQTISAQDPAGPTY